MVIDGLIIQNKWLPVIFILVVGWIIYNIIVVWEMKRIEEEKFKKMRERWVREKWK